MPFSSIKSLNKQLNTNNKSIIKAINELLERLKQNDATIVTFNKHFNEQVGNLETEPEDWTNLQKIDRNVIRSIYKVYLEIQGTGTADISSIAPSVKEAILELNDTLQALDERVDILEEKLDDVEFKEDLFPDPNFPNQFVLAYIPNDRKLILSINGIDYEEDDAFTVDRPNKKITWIFTLPEGGFDIDLDFNLEVHYFYEPEQLN